MGQGRQQTERITSRQAGSVRQAANDRERESTVQVVHGKTNYGKPLGNVSQGKTRLRNG